MLVKLFGPIMRVLYGVFRNYGLAIIFFTLFSKIVLLPVNIWVQKNSIKMVKMEPELNEIKAAHFGDKDTIADEQAKLYKREKYNPLASLIPLFIQIILLLGVVEVIYHPLNIVLDLNDQTINELTTVASENNETIDLGSNSIQLSVIDDIQGQEHEKQYVDRIGESTVNSIKDLKMDLFGFNLGWIANVKGGIAWLAPVLAALSSWLLSYFQNRINVLQAEQSTLNKYGMMAFSVCLSLYLGTFVPAGVALYWVASNLLAIVQQYLLNKMIDPAKYVDYERLEKSRAALKELEGPKKKFKFSDAQRKRSKEDYKRFLSVGNMHLVFYSESSGFYKYYAGYIDYILKNTDIPIHYVTNDINDDIFRRAKENPQIKPYYIDPTTMITLFMKMDADMVVMTIPDLDNFQYKRSYINKNAIYINVQHGMDSLNLTYRKGALDHYDVIFTTGPHQTIEVRQTEELYGLPKKEIVECGYPLLDDMRKAYREREHVVNEKKTVLIAPSWQKDNIIDLCLEDLLESIRKLDIQIIVRPHPQHVRHMPEKMEALKKKYEGTNIEIQTDFSSSDTVMDSDLLITDWSSIAYEYAYTTDKPVLFINTPMKVMNPEWEKIEERPINIWMRDMIGASVEVDQIETASEKVSYLLDHSDEYKLKIEKFVNDYTYNLGNSGAVGGRYLVETLFSRIERKAAKNEE